MVINRKLNSVHNSIFIKLNNILYTYIFWHPYRLITILSIVEVTKVLLRYSAGANMGILMTFYKKSDLFSRVWSMILSNA